MKNRIKNAIIVVLFFLLGILCFVACDENEIPETITLKAVDRHIKLNDEVFDFTADMPAGTTVDISKVDFTTVGVYDIVYSHDKAESVTKKVYVYDVPQFYRNGKTLDSAVTLNYNAETIYNFADASQLKVSALDSFGTPLNVSVTAYDDYSGNYGDYTVTYSATDKAGNVASKSVVYTVSGAENIEIDDFTFDLSESEKTITVDLSKAAAGDIRLTVDGTEVSASDFTVIGKEGIKINVAAFKNVRFNNGENKKDVAIRLHTKTWYSDFTVTVTDTGTPRFDVYGDGWFFTENTEIVLPAPQKTTVQQFTFAYEASGGLNVLEYDGELFLNKADGGNIPKGEYTVTVNAMRGETKAGAKNIKIDVYDIAGYGAAVAASTVQGTDSEDFADFDFDPDMNAYHYVVTPGSSIPGTAVYFDGAYLEMYQYGYKSASKLKFDIYFNSEKGSFQGLDYNWTKNLIFLDQNANYSLNGSIATIYQGDKTVLYENLQDATWYTVELDLNGISGTGYFVARYNTTTDIVDLGRDLWIRNIRFDNQPAIMSTPQIAPPVIADAEYAIADTGIDIAIDWPVLVGGRAITIGGITPKAEEYRFTQTGVTLYRSAFSTFLENMVEDEVDVTVVISTGNWSQSFTVTVTDKGAPTFDVYGNNWFFMEGITEIILPGVEKHATLRPYTLEFKISGGLTVVESDGKLVITNADGGISAGTYTITVNAIRGGVTETSQNITLHVYADTDYYSAVAESMIMGDGTDNNATFVYDAVMNAYHYKAIPGSGPEGTRVNMDGIILEKFKQGYQSATTFKFDVYYNPKASTIASWTENWTKDLLILFQDSRYSLGDEFVKIYLSDDPNKKTIPYIDYSSLDGGVWYTIEVVLPENREDVTFLFSRMNETVVGDIPGLGRDLWVRNFRFDNGAILF